MKMHLLLALMGLVMSACASKRDIASTNQDRETLEQAQHAQMIDGQASRIR